MAYSRKDWESVIAATSDAIDLAEEEENAGEAHFLRALAKGASGDQTDAITDLETAIEFDYNVDECNSLIKKFGG